MSDKARVVAQRALKTINFREEQEKFNVWIAWLNLENIYGTTEAYDQLFEVPYHCSTSERKKERKKERERERNIESHYYD